MSEIIINVLAADPDDATSFYRAWGPMKQLRLNANVRLVSETAINWRTMSTVDVVFMHNPYTLGHIAIIHQAISQKIPIWVDYDDNLYDLPEWHYSYAKLAAAGHKQNIVKICNLCSAITVSTEPLRLKLLQLTNKEITVIENYLPFPYPEWKLSKFTPDPVFKILWRGGKAHHIDVASYLPLISHFVETHRNIELHLIGEPASLFHCDEITKHAKIVVYPIMELSQYFNFLATRPAHIGIVPIEPSEFSNCISSNAWKEYLHGGMLSVKPDGFYNGLPFNYHDRLGFLAELEKLCDFYYDQPGQFHNQIIVERAIVKSKRDVAIEARIAFFKKLINHKK